LKKKCKCGCGKLIEEFDKRGRIKFYAVGHINKGKSNTWKIKEQVKVRTSRERAMKKLREAGITKCQVNNKLCSVQLETHHIDKNPFNNELSNLLLLCGTHHNFADKRDLSLQELKELHPTYIISSDKRRYTW